MNRRGECKWRYAYVDGVKSLPDKGLHGVCRGCGSPMISKCGHFVVNHWAHKPGYGTDCAPHYEGIGPWHRGWQDLVQDEYAEVKKPPHWADIVTLDGLVIELQHSLISVETIAEREAFYEDMIWVFDATNRFEMITVGRRTFFSLKKTKHIAKCTKPVFLDFGNLVVEVEAFSDAVAKLDGFGRTRSREWFAQRYLSGILKETTKQQLLKSAEAYEKRKYGDVW